MCVDFFFGGLLIRNFSSVGLVDKKCEALEIMLEKMLSMAETPQTRLKISLKVPPGQEQQSY